MSPSSVSMDKRCPSGTLARALKVTFSSSESNESWLVWLATQFGFRTTSPRRLSVRPNARAGEISGRHWPLPFCAERAGNICSNAVVIKCRGWPAFAPIRRLALRAVFCRASRMSRGKSPGCLSWALSMASATPLIICCKAFGLANNSGWEARASSVASAS